MYFEALVAIKTDNNGKIKINKENYLVDAMSVTEAELRVIKDFKEAGFSQDFEVIGVKKSSIVSVIEAKSE